MNHFSFTEIGQYKQAIRAVRMASTYVGKDDNGDPIYDGSILSPKIKFRGTVKLHGTNAAIAKDLITGEYSVQSKENIISVEKDNYGFARYLTEVATSFGHLFPEVLFSLIPNDLDLPVRGDVTDEAKNAIVIYGEWCGGNIQKNVGITGLPKMFVVFAVRYKGAWLPEDLLKEVKLPEADIFNILDYPTFEMEIDFNNPELSQNALIDLTIAVENECPVSKAFGVTGVGEGIVWRPVDLRAWPNSGFWFKVKGAKHSVTKTKSLAPVDTEKLNTINEFIDATVTENRLNQAVGVIKLRKNVPMLTNADIGDFIRWVFDDIKKEESDTIAASGLADKEIGGAVAKRAKEWFFKNS